MDPLRTAATPETRLHFLDYWRIIRIRKAVIILVFLLVSITATFVTFLLPKSYSSKARIRVNHDTTDIPNMTGMPAMSGYDPFFIQTEFAVIQSELILDKVIERPDLNLNKVWTDKFHQTTPLKTADSRRILKGMLELTPERNTSLIDITVYSDDANEAAKLAEAVAETYKQYRKEQFEESLTHGIAVFDREKTNYEDQIQRQETNVDRLRTELQVVDTDPQSSSPGSTLGPVNIMAYNNQKIEKEIQAASLGMMLTQLTNLGPRELQETLPSVTPDAILTSLLQDRNSAESALVKQRVTLGESHPDVLTTIKLIDTTERQITNRVNGILESMRTQLAAANASAAEVDRQLEAAKQKDLEVTARTRPYYLEKAKLEQLKRFEEVLFFRAGQDKMNVKIPAENVVVIVDKAEVKPQPVRPNRPVNIALGIIIGLVVGMGLAFFIEYLDTSVKTIDDVERTLQAPVLGVIPQNVGYLLEEGAESPHAEAYRVLRTNLLFSRKDDKLNTIAVVSAGAGEGKSTTVCNLATVFAQGGQRVLMVDSDLRRPTLHKLLQVNNTLGLTNYLLKQNTLEEVIQTIPQLPSLDFMASGKLPSSSLGILNSAQMKDLITELKRRYDFIFFDSPPIMGVSDASILASEVDMTLQVIQYRRYPQPMNIRAKQLIEKVGGNLIGIVLNNINMAQDESYYYYSGYYHDYYSKNDDDDGAASNGSARDKSRGDIKPKT
jgi:polysaccharide biosynthesis transport protein